ncbi:rhythmically expressed gene 2 protein-like [Lycorma delicatula]|uniref:rhythmically expressed gene 2 protein-like n=1 Tax=Lycorma delicatula TaxID=130591 RepID=UPI003F51594B
MKLCRLITLDIMGTILDVCLPVGVHYSQVGAKFGLNINPQLLNDNFKKGWYEMKVKHPNYGRHTGLGWENWWKQLVHHTFVNSSLKPLDHFTLNEISHQLIDMYNHPEQWRCCDGALDFINHVHQRQIPLAVLSNFDERLEVLLENMNVRKYFRFVVGSYDVGCEKPDKRIFDLVETIARTMDDLSDIKKSEILHIGDTPELDYLPAKSAGWNAYLISKTSKDITEKYPNICKEFIFKDLHELKQVFT